MTNLKNLKTRFPFISNLETFLILKIRPCAMRYEDASNNPYCHPLQLLYVYSQAP